MMGDLLPGERIRRIRLELGLSQVELAGLLGVSNVTVNRWEHDKSTPQPETRSRLLRAEVLGIGALQARPVAVASAPARSGPGTSDLVGRERDLARLLVELQPGRVVTIVGPGGVGKTSLALEAGDLLADRFPDGIWFVDLTSLGVRQSITDEVARVMGIRAATSAKLAERVRSRLATGAALVVLDNCEHVTAGCREFIDSCFDDSGQAAIF
ncbi:MAG TPA: helix-turn-helix domain-containing protein, partial [Thermomicrobiales bacterium]|nr:helix-turn-helix domain-containing protein [Thermomicrobiales bacterium]